jgi:hypothetical protein
MGIVQSSQIKTGMAFVITVRMQAREEAIPRDVGWVISIAMVMDKEIAPEVETVINTGMAKGIKIRPQRDLRNQTVRISHTQLTKEPKYS